MRKVYNDNDFEPEGYIERHTVRCVILDDKDRVSYSLGTI